MKRHVLAMIFLMTVIKAQADVVPSSQVFVPADNEVIITLAQRSGLSEADLEPLLSNCDSSQQSMYFCSYRDLVRSDMVSTHIIAEKKQSFSLCKKLIDKKIASWKKHNNRSCAQSAKAEWGNGSMMPTAQNYCMIAATNAMNNKINNIIGCDKSKLFSKN